MEFKIGDYAFEETFIIMTITPYPIIGLAPLRKHSAILDTAQGTIDFPQIQITLALKDEMQKCNPEPITIKTEEKRTIPAQATRIIHASITVSNDHPITETVQPLPHFDENAKLIVAPAITTARDKRVAIKTANTTDFPDTKTPHTKLAELQILKPEETKLIRAVDIAALSLLIKHDDVVAYVNAQMQVDSPEQTEEKIWFPTPENPGNVSEHTPILQRILRELRELHRLEELDPKQDEKSRSQFLSLFKWNDSLISGEDRENLESILVEFNDIFARHRLDIGMNNQFKVCLTPKNDKPVYTQSLPVPINLKGDLTVELALMHKYGIITTLPFSKYASPIFAQRKPNGKLRLLVDLRKIKALISDDYINNNHPISTLSDAAQHLAGKQKFKVCLTPKNDKPVYTQSLPVPINLKGDLTVELALMHKYGIITTLPFSEYASPIFAQRKPNGKLRLLVDLRKINALISDDYINNNHPISTLSDAAQHLAGKQLFCKLDCS